MTRQSNELFGIVALVDIFTCATSMVLMMLLFADSGKGIPKQSPQADAVIECDRGQADDEENPLVRIAGAPEKPPFPASAEGLSLLAGEIHSAHRLSIRLQFESFPAEIACRLAVQTAVSELASEFDRTDSDRIPRLVLLDTVLIAPEPSRAGTEL